MPTIVAAHTDDVIGIYLDELNLNIYSASQDGWITVTEGDRCMVINKHECASEITYLHADPTYRRLFVALDEGNI